MLEAEQSQERQFDCIPSIGRAKSGSHAGQILGYDIKAWRFELRPVSRI